MIKVYNDCKGKHQSFEASLVLNKDERNGHSNVEIFGYGETDIEAVHNLRQNAKSLTIDLFLALESEIQRTDRMGTPLTKEEIEAERQSAEDQKFLKQFTIV